VAIQDPCHLRHAQRVTAEPRAILEAGGYQVVEIDPAGMCCGAAGLYTLLQPEASQKLADQKAAQIRAAGASRIASANPGCEMQLRSALGGEYQIAHPIEWYLDAIKASASIGIVPPVQESN
jgi:glycolate oxidase iron-sulfur subunit